MALEGTIKEFGVADILQLMAQQQKTGILVVEHGDRAAEIYFAGGTVIATQSSGQADRAADMLEHSGLVPPEVLCQARERQRETFEFIGQILLRDGHLGREHFERIVTTLAYETFFDILQWREGTYRFVADTARESAASVPLPGLESILLDVLRMIDEWPEIRKAIRSGDAVYAQTGQRSAEELEEEELPVYALVDGRRPAGEIIAGSLLGRHSAGKILTELAQDGFISMISEYPRRRSRARAERALPPAVVPTSWGIAGVLALVAVVLILVQFPRVVPVMPGAWLREPLIGRAITARYARGLKQGVAMYHFHSGKYPETPAEVVARGFLSEASLQACAEHGIAYQRLADGSGFRVSVSGEAPEQGAAPGPEPGGRATVFP